MQVLTKLTAMSLPILLTEAASGTNIYGNYYVDVNLDENDDSKVIFTLQMEADTWLGLGLGSTGMAVNTDMI